ncbi:MAG TPA: sn-glycerol-1-phosphate dehydrogenase [Candidatus Paceibacterota bacterium]|nr:sn-glycerol-1-phosphate dehydrogenase [Verrucomicrobiota bacterium]HSA10948.1 sn-glycerol-1-phosphate dehydrogenase [Candidatus Paceibacterota bacterium]
MKEANKTLSLAEALNAARDTRCLEIGAGVKSAAARVFNQQFGKRPAVVVADVNTYRAAGRAVDEAFRAAGHAVRDPFIFRAPDLHAEHQFVTDLEQALRGHTAIPVAVGSGTINDLTKLASHRTGRLYMCVGTAASMDGYTAYGASITYQGSKQTFECPAPAAVLADLEVICAAPGDMNSWGYADLLAKVPAGADWILADALGIDPILPQPWAIVQGRLRELVADPVGVRRRHPGAIGRLVEGLMMGGFAMQAARSSRVASGAEHMFSHMWDMQHHTHDGHVPSHGFKVGIGTLATTALYERLLVKELEKLDVAQCCAAWPDEEAWVARARDLLGGGAVAELGEREMRAKYCSAAQLGEQLRLLKAAWHKLRERLGAQLLPLATLRQMLQDVGAPTEPEQIGITRERLRQTYWQASCIRRRYTVLDLAVRTRLLDTCLDEIFGPAGLWPTSASARTSTKGES